MVSETTPERRRMVMAGVKGLCGLSGFLFGNLLMYLSDPSLVHLRWRQLFLLCSVPCVVLGTLAWAYLPESPAFLAQSGKREAARRVLESMRWLNGRPEVSIDFVDPNEDATDRESAAPPNVGGAQALSIRSQLGIILGPNMLGLTLTALMLNLAINLINYNHNYGEPQVFTSGKATMALEPATQLMVANCF